jgi:hypothetical protein
MLWTRAVPAGHSATQLPLETASVPEQLEQLLAEEHTRHPEEHARQAEAPW